jgi:Stage II sporulation protein E (SpoIIE)
VAPFHPLRYEARAFAARALAALAIFCTLSVVLLAGSAPGPAEAKHRGNDNSYRSWDDDDGDRDYRSWDDDGDYDDDSSPQGRSHGWGGGGGGKWDPPDPEEPETPPTNTTPTPPVDPAPAPDDDDDDGDWDDDDGDDDGRGDDDEEEPDPTGAGGKGDTPEPDPVPTGGNQTPSQPTEPTAPAPPVTQGPTPAQPGPVSLGREPRGGQGNGANGNRISAERASGSGLPAPGDVAGVGGTVADFEPAPAVGADIDDPVGQAENGGDGSANPNDRRGSRAEATDPEAGPPIIREIPRFVNEVPAALKGALAVLGVLSFLLGLGYLVTSMRNRALARQRRDLLQEVGLLQSALLPPVPDRVGGLRTSVAYRPADGPGAGGDFYDVLPLPGGRVGFILGDVSGHGRGALARTAFMRYTLRAYLEAGLEPRVALQVAGRVIDENLGGDFATVLLAVHDPETGSLTYATAGHPAPLVVGPQPHEPVTAGSSPPIGVGVRTGLRQTTVPLVSGSVAAMFTDGLLEARTEGGLLGRQRLSELLEEMGDDATARGLVESVNKEARVMSDDIAAVVIQPTNAATAGLFRTEQLELTARELDGPIAERFLEACEIPDAEVQAALYDARMIADRFGGVILHVVFGNRLRVEVLPRNVESIEAASRRAAAAR